MSRDKFNLFFCKDTESNSQLTQLPNQTREEDDIQVTPRITFTKKNKANQNVGQRMQTTSPSQSTSLLTAIEDVQLGRNRQDGKRIQLQRRTHAKPPHVTRSTHDNDDDSTNNKAGGDGRSGGRGTAGGKMKTQNKSMSQNTAYNAFVQRNNAKGKSVNDDKKVIPVAPVNKSGVVDGDEAIVQINNDKNNNILKGNCDLEESFDEKMSLFEPRVLQVTSKPIDLKTAINLKKLVFGDVHKVLPNNWIIVNLKTRKDHIFANKKCGPCGLMWSLNCHFLRHSTFSDYSSKTSPKILAHTLSEIFWTAGQSKYAAITTCEHKVNFTTSSRCLHDKFTEKIVINSFMVYTDLEEFIFRNIKQYLVNYGILHVVYSLCLSRGTQNIYSDSDATSSSLSLINAYNLCTRELMTLCSSGRAFSHLVNSPGGGEPGLQCRQDVGVLCFNENNTDCQLGTFVKTPRYPIWLLELADRCCGGGVDVPLKPPVASLDAGSDLSQRPRCRYALVISSRASLTCDWKAECTFQLSYFSDDLSAQKLFLDTTDEHFVAQKCKDDNFQKFVASMGLDLELDDIDDDNIELSPLFVTLRNKWKDVKIEIL